MSTERIIYTVDLSNMDTLGTKRTVLISEVSLFQRCPLGGVPLYIMMLQAPIMSTDHIAQLQHLHVSLMIQWMV